MRVQDKTAAEKETMRKKETEALRRFGNYENLKKC